MNTRSKGNRGETLAANFLLQLGWKILERNVHYRFGEVDILADAGDYVVIVEVKAKRSLSHGAAIEMITASKKQVLRQLAKFIASGYNKPVRVDVIAIDKCDSDQPVITHYPFAVGDS